MPFAACHIENYGSIRRISVAACRIFSIFSRKPCLVSIIGNYKPDCSLFSLSALSTNLLY